MANDFLAAFLEETPNILYGAMRPQNLGAGRGSSWIDYWKGQQGDIYSQYLSNLGKTALGGQVPTQSYRSFLEGYPWLQKYLGLAPSERGERAALYSPRMRWSL